MGLGRLAISFGEARKHRGKRPSLDYWTASGRQQIASSSWAVGLLVRGFCVSCVLVHCAPSDHAGLSTSKLMGLWNQALDIGGGFAF